MAIWKVDEKAPTIALGSHLDNVYNGGGYDGVSGVLKALATVKALIDGEVQPNRNIANYCICLRIICIIWSFNYWK